MPRRVLAAVGVLYALLGVWWIVAPDRAATALGLGIAGMAIVQGRHAAEALHARLRGLEPQAVTPDLDRQLVGPDEIIMEFHEKRPPAHAERLAPEERLAEPLAEVSGTITEEQFLEEVQR